MPSRQQIDFGISVDDGYFEVDYRDRGAVERGTAHNDERTVGADRAFAFEVK